MAPNAAATNARKAVSSLDEKFPSFINLLMLGDFEMGMRFPSIPLLSAMRAYKLDQLYSPALSCERLQSCSQSRRR
jgi:hypothetical protein